MQDAGCIGPDLDSGANFVKLPRLFVHVHIEAGLKQR